jgi:hypothetical protein
MNDQKQQKKDIQLERRAIISPLFLTVLMGIAYDRMLEVAHKSLLSGLIVNDLLLIATFLLVSMRFFIGNQLYLVSDDFKKLKELAWLYDYFVITGQTICIVFLGNFSSVQANGYSSIGFLQFLLVLYVIDVAWIISLVILSELFSYFRRPCKSIPVKWAFLNTFLIFAIIILNFIVSDLYSTTGLVWLLCLNLIGFIVDVVIVDHHDSL